MTLTHRKLLQFAAVAAAASMLPHLAAALDYPTKPVRVIVPFVPAGASDIFARLVGGYLSERFGQQFFIENRTGATGNIGTEALVRAAPDGYTLLMVDSSPTINATLYDKLNFNFIRDVAPIATVVRVPSVMTLHPSVPAKTVSGFIAYAKMNPGRINFGSGGSGSPIHMIAELFEMMAGVNLVHVPYRGGGAALVDLLGGQIQVMFPTLSSSVEYIRAGNLRPLAVTSATRSAALPDLPTVGDYLAGYEASSFFGLVAPKDTPAEIVDKLNREINSALADPKIKARIADLGGEVLSGSPADFRKLIADETEKWGKVIRTAKIKAE
jgi:tripartite-type tricarboxylate transporter receptor subunit TctC